MYEGKLGVGIISFKRHSKLENLIASLEQQTHLEETDFHLFQDGAVCTFTEERKAFDKQIERSAEVFDTSALPRKEKHVRGENVGNAIHQFEAFEFMSDEYKKFIIVENDVVLSPHWFRLTRVLYEQFEDKDDVFSFDLAFRRMSEEIESNLKKVIVGVTPHWWCEAIFADRWERARPIFEEYYELVRYVPYQCRPHGAIRKLFRKYGWEQNATSQDGGKDMALHAMGMKRACTLVNRGFADGYPGMHTRESWWDEQGFEEQKPYVFDGDAELDEFEILRKK